MRGVPGESSVQRAFLAARLAGSTARRGSKAERAPLVEEVEVDEVDASRVSARTEHKIGGLDVTVENATRMDVLHRRELHGINIRYRGSFEKETIDVGRPFAVPSLRSFSG